MVQAVTDPIILRKFTHIWVPPGMFILMTVLAFNFVGDGLRDAFDPKMKR
jgi:peptide/nickel transport system permease protein